MNMSNLYSFPVSIVLAVCCWTSSFGAAGVIVDNLADLEVRYENFGYVEGRDEFDSRISLKNTGSTDIDVESQDVNVYVCFIRLIIGSNTADGVELKSNGDSKATAHHLDGCTHKLTFHAPFTLKKLQTLDVKMTQDLWMVAYTDVMPNWYVQLGSESQYRLLNSTTQDQTKFVSSFSNETQYLRNSGDKIPPWTPDERLTQFRFSQHSVDEVAVKNRLIPSLSSPFQNTSTTMVGKFNSIADISFNFTKNMTYARDAHSIQIKPAGDVEITAASKESFILSQSTVQQMLERYDGKLPVGILHENKPRLGYRGFSLDMARHFYDKDRIKRHLDLMWRYKLNTLHLHFTDDESWAVEIEALPELVQIGSKQCFNVDTCATYPQLGRINNEAGQYLSKQDYIDIVSYAKSKGIEVIPEVDLPGHATAAVKAMKVRHQRDPTAVDYRLHDPEDTSEYLTVQYFTRSAMNPCVNSSYDFIQLIAETLVSYHEQAGQPLRVLHLGGDEVPEEAWNHSPACQAVLTQKNETTGYLKKIMLQRMGQIGIALNLSLAFWEDGLIDRDVPNTPYIKDDIFPRSLDVFAYTWQTVWEWGGGNRPYNMANSGYKVILAPATRFYLDHPHEPNPQERGYYWARRFANMIRPYSFRVNNYYANIDGPDRMGTLLFEDTFCTTAGNCPALTRPENIVGGEAIIFSETIFTQDDMDNNVWPRLMAIAERLWTEAEWEQLGGEFPDGLTEDFSLFNAALEKYELPHLDKFGVNYHLSPPAFSVKENNDGSNTLSDFTVEFTTQKVWMRDGATRKTLGPLDTYTYKLGKTIYFYSSTQDETRFSYEIEFYKPQKPKDTSSATSGSLTWTIAGGSILSLITIF